MTNNPILPVVITTHNRTRVACETIDSLCKNLVYAGEIKWIVSDDRSDYGHVQALVDCFAKYGITPICKYTNDNYFSLGASMNNGLLEAFQFSDVCLTTEDDWILHRKLDITPHVQMLVEKQDLAAIRLACITPKSLLKKYDGNYSLVYGNLTEKKNAIFNNQVALRHRRVYQLVGYYYPNISTDNCEGSYRDRFNKFTKFGTENLHVLWPSELPIHTMDDPNLYFIHCGVSTVGHIKYKVPERYLHFYNDRVVNICMVMDNGYADQVLALIQNLKERMYCKKAIYVIAWDVSWENKAMIERLNGGTCKVKVVTALPYYIQQCMEAGGYERAKNRYTVPPTGLLKFCIADILKDIDKVLYIDGDIVIFGSLEDLYDVNVDNFYCAAVPDIGSVTMRGRELFKLMQNNPNYFNSGVMLLNLAKLREDKMMGELFHIKKNLEDRSLMDQDALNIGFAGKVKLLPAKFNYLRAIDTSAQNGRIRLEKINELYGTDYADLDSMRKDILIYHFAGWTKPWRPVQDWWKNCLERSKILKTNALKQETTIIEDETETKEEPREEKPEPIMEEKRKPIFDVKEPAKIDAVYILGSGSKYNDLELLFSITSLTKYCSSWLGNIYIVGSKPRCNLSKYKHAWIPCPDLYSPSKGNKDTNIINKINHAIKNIPNLSDVFLKCSDDQVVLSECNWKEFLPHKVMEFNPDDKIFKESCTNGYWLKNLYKTLTRFIGKREKIYYYEPHKWSLIEKKSFAEMCESINICGEGNCLFTLYYNWINYENPKQNQGFRFFAFPKISFTKDFSDPELKYVGYNDSVFCQKKFRSELLAKLR